MHFCFFILYNKWAHIKCSSDVLGEHCAGYVQIWALSCSDFSLFVFSFHKLAYFPVKTSHLKCEIQPFELRVKKEGFASELRLSF